MKALQFNPDGRGCTTCKASPTVRFSTLCEAHYMERHNRMSPAAKRGAQLRRLRNPDQFPPPGSEVYWAQHAHRVVAAAIRQGLLPSLKSGEYACTDCGGIALEYDHRDYGRPLDVVPVCRSCNKRRGTAIWPSQDQFQFKRVRS